MADSLGRRVEGGAVIAGRGARYARAPSSIDIDTVGWVRVR